MANRLKKKSQMAELVVGLSVLFSCLLDNADDIKVKVEKKGSPKWCNKGKKKNQGE